MNNLKKRTVPEAKYGLFSNIDADLGNMIPYQWWDPAAVCIYVETKELNIKSYKMFFSIESHVRRFDKERDIGSFVSSKFPLSSTLSAFTFSLPALSKAHQSLSTASWRSPLGEVFDFLVLTMLLKTLLHLHSAPVDPFQ